LLFTSTVLEQQLVRLDMGGPPHHHKSSCSSSRTRMGRQKPKAWNLIGSRRQPSRLAGSGCETLWRLRGGEKLTQSHSQPVSPRADNLAGNLWPSLLRRRWRPSSTVPPYFPSILSDHSPLFPLDPSSCAPVSLTQASGWETRGSGSEAQGHP
jgi:hypothetical protein